MNFKKIDIENWARKEHYRYYTEKLKIEVNMTASIDVKNLLDFCYIHNYKFYPTVIYIVTKVLKISRCFGTTKEIYAYGIK